MGIHVSPILNPLPPPSPSHPSGSSQCTSPEHPVSCLRPGLAICYTYDNIHVSMLFSQIIPPSPSPTESKSLFFISVSLLLSHIWGHRYHLSKFQIYGLVCCIGVFLSDLLHPDRYLNPHPTLKSHLQDSLLSRPRANFKKYEYNFLICFRLGWLPFALRMQPCPGGQQALLPSSGLSCLLLPLLLCHSWPDSLESCHLGFHWVSQRLYPLACHWGFM